MTEEAVKTDARIDLRDVVKMKYLSPDEAFFTEKDGFVSFTKKVTECTGDGGEKTEEKTFDRVFLHRAFPFDLPDEYISVLDKDQAELGLIRRLSDFPEETVALLNRELKRKYFIFTIKKIFSVNERYGFSYWRVEDNDGEREFTLQDTYRSISKITSDRVLIIDVDGNRYEIPSLEALDRKSYKKIELFL